MTKRVALAALLGALLTPSLARAGTFELSLSGWYNNYNNGLVGSEPSRSIVKRYGAGLGYYFTEATAIEFNYTHSDNYDNYGIDEGGPTRTVISKTNRVDNFSADLVLNFASRKERFRPYIRGGVGYMIRKVRVDGSSRDKTTGVATTLNLEQTPSSKSVSGDGGIGLKIGVTDRMALEASFNIIATDIDKSEIYLHYSASGGLRFYF